MHKSLENEELQHILALGIAFKGKQTLLKAKNV